MNRRLALQSVALLMAGMIKQTASSALAFRNPKPTSFVLVLDPDVPLRVEYKGETVTIDKDELMKALRGPA